MSHREILSRFGLANDQPAEGVLDVTTPIDGTRIATLAPHTSADVEAMVVRATAAFKAWRGVPAPRRGELVRLLGEELRAAKADLGALVTLESGKITPGGAGRSAGNDRHLRLRGRSVATTLWPDDVVRAARAHDARKLAPRRRVRRHHGVQLPGGSVVLERGAGPGLRRSCDLEATPRRRHCRRLRPSKSSRARWRVSAMRPTLSRR